VEQEFEWSMPPARFVLSRGCVEVGAATLGRRRRGLFAGLMTMTENAVLTAASEAIHRMTVRGNVAGDAGSLFSVLLMMLIH